jgi:hypothetical protein
MLFGGHKPFPGTSRSCCPQFRRLQEGLLPPNLHSICRNRLQQRLHPPAQKLHSLSPADVPTFCFLLSSECHRAACTELQVQSIVESTRGWMLGRGFGGHWHLRVKFTRPRHRICGLLFLAILAILLAFSAATTCPNIFSEGAP